VKFIKGDQIKITSGKDKGKTAEITKVFYKKDQVLAKGINTVKRHIKGREGVESGIITLEKPISTAKIILICPACSQSTRVGFKTPKSGSKTRICKKCHSVITQKSTTTKTTKKKK